MRQQFSNQPAFATAKVQHPLGTALAQGAHHRGHAYVVQAHGSFELLLGTASIGVLGILGNFVWLILGELGERKAGKARPVLQVAARDEVAFRVVGEPRAAVAHQLIHFVSTSSSPTQ